MVSFVKIPRELLVLLCRIKHRLIYFSVFVILAPVIYTEFMTGEKHPFDG